MSVILENIFNQPRSLRRTFDHLAGEGFPALEDAAITIRQAHHLVLSGMGSSHFACIPLQYYLARYGIISTVIETSELLHYQMENFANCAIVLVSRSGETVEALKVLPKLKDLNAAVIGVTNEPESTLAREADVTLLMESYSDELVAVQTYTSSLLVLLLLGSMLVENEYENGKEQAGALVQLDWDSQFKQWAESTESLSREFRPISSVYLLGRGPSIASALEGALMLHEAAKIPAVSMSAGEFRHGPIEVVDQDYLSFIFAPEDHTQGLNIALGQEIAAAGGNTAIIGPGDESYDGLRWIHLPPVPPLFSPILEIMPIQFFAVHLAQARGIPLGQFKIATQVTRSEIKFSEMSDEG